MIDLLIYDFIADSVSWVSVQRDPKLDFIIYNYVLVTFKPITVFDFKVIVNVIEAKLFMDIS